MDGAARERDAVIAEHDRGGDVGAVVIHEQALVGEEIQAIAGREVHARIRLGATDHGGDHECIEIRPEVKLLEEVLEARPAVGYDGHADAAPLQRVEHTADLGEDLDDRDVEWAVELVEELARGFADAEQFEHAAVIVVPLDRHRGHVEHCAGRPRSRPRTRRR